MASNLNPVAGQKSANLVLVGVGAGGQVSLFNHDGPLDLVVDVVGWVPSVSGVQSVVPM